MGQFLAIPDVVAVAADRLVAIVRVDSDGSVVVRDLANGNLSTTSASQLRAPASAAAPANTTLLAIAHATDAQWERARRRAAAIAELAASSSSGSSAGDQVAAAAARLGVSRRTVFRLLAAYHASPKTSSLLPHARGTPAGDHRIHDKLEQLIAEVIRDVYLTKVRVRKEEVVRRVVLRCSAEGLTPPSRKAILARIGALDVRRVANARLQPKEAAALYRSVPGTYKVDRALDVVQIDHTLIDAVVVDETHRCNPHFGGLLCFPGGPVLNFRRAVSVAGSAPQGGLVALECANLRLARLGNTAWGPHRQRRRLHQRGIAPGM